MLYIQNLLVAFIFSFIGSIPPGSINLSVIQLSLNYHFKDALKFALAAALVEFVYATIAVKFESLITDFPVLADNFQLISALVMVVLGLSFLYNNKRSSKKQDTENELNIATNGFRKGVIISILNPLAIPFWIAVTAYLKGMNWIDLNSIEIWSYIAGISLGTFGLLVLLAVYSKKAAKYIRKDSTIIRNTPGVILLGLGIYSLIDYLL